MRPYNSDTPDVKSARAVGFPLAHGSGIRDAIDPGSPTFFQSNRNRLTAKKNRAHIAHLTYPNDFSLKKAYKEAQYAEEHFNRIHRAGIKREVKSGHRDDFVPAQSYQPPGLFPSLESGSMAGNGSAAEYRNPYRERKIRMDELVNKTATAWVNRPGPETEKAYKQALGARTLFESQRESFPSADRVPDPAPRTVVRTERETRPKPDRMEAAPVFPANPGPGNRVYELGVRSERIKQSDADVLRRGEPIR